MAAWTEIRDGSRYAVARRLKLGGTVGVAITLGSGSAEKPAIGVDRSGQFVVAWARDSDVVARRIASTSVFSTKVLTSPIASYGGFGMVLVGVDRDGDAVITYHSGGGSVSQVWASRWSRTGTLAAPLRISASTDNVGFHHALATDLDGDSMIVWTRYSSGKLELLGRRLSAAGARSTVTSPGAQARTRSAPGASFGIVCNEVRKEPESGGGQEATMTALALFLLVIGTTLILVGAVLIALGAVLILLGIALIALAAFLLIRRALRRQSD